MRIIYFIIISGFAVLSSCGPRPNSNENVANKSEQEATTDPTLAELNKKIIDDPNNYSNYLSRAKYYGSLEKYELAFKDVERALQVDSTKSDIYLYRGQLHWYNQEVRPAYEDYKQCLVFDARNTDCLLKKAAIDIVLENYSLALEHINSALKENDRLAEAYFLKGTLYSATKDTSLSSSSYQTAIEVDPTYFDAYINLGLLYAAQHHDLAKEYYNSAIDLRPKSIEAWYNKAIFLQENGYRNKKYYGDAIACYDSIAHIDSTFSAAYYNKGYIRLVFEKNYSAAETDFTRAIIAFPDYYQAYYNRGLSFEARKMKKEAEADYRQALKIQPKYDEAAKALSRVLGE